MLRCVPQSRHKSSLSNEERDWSKRYVNQIKAQPRGHLDVFLFVADFIAEQSVKSGREQLELRTHRVHNTSNNAVSMNIHVYELSCKLHSRTDHKLLGPWDNEQTWSKLFLQFTLVTYSSYRVNIRMSAWFINSVISCPKK